MARLTITLADLKASLATPTPLARLSPPLVALWHDAKGEWDAAHKVAQDIDSEDGAWIHAYLHRKEGDEGNAAYWYRRAGRPVSTLSLDAEWDQIAEELLRRSLESC